MPERTLVVMGGGSLLPPYDPKRDEFILSLARRPTPRVAFVATASGDSDGYTAAFFRSVGSLDCVATDLTLFERREVDLRRFVLRLDVVYVGGGNTLSLLAVWRAHGLDEILRDAWHEGIVLCGVSAGMNCWFEQSITDSYGVGTARVLDDGLGFLPGSCCPHYDAEEARRPRLSASRRPPRDRPGLRRRRRRRAGVCRHRTTRSRQLGAVGLRVSRRTSAGWRPHRAGSPSPSPWLSGRSVGSTPLST